MRPGGAAGGPQSQHRDAGRGGKPARGGARQEPSQGPSPLARRLEGEGGAADGAAVGALWREGSFLGGEERGKGGRETKGERGGRDQGREGREGERPRERGTGERRGQREDGERGKEHS